MTGKGFPGLPIPEAPQPRPSRPFPDLTGFVAGNYVSINGLAYYVADSSYRHGAVSTVLRGHNATLVSVEPDTFELTLHRAPWKDEEINPR